MVYISYFCVIGDETLGKICYSSPLMSSHGIIKISEFFQILIADNSLTTEYISWYATWPLGFDSGPWSFVLCLFWLWAEESGRDFDILLPPSPTPAGRESVL